MKKTLIALMTASSMAMAVSLEDADFAQDGNAGYDTMGGHFTVALELDIEELRVLLEEGQAPAWGTNIVNYVCNGSDTGVTVNGASRSGQISSSNLYARWSTMTNWNNVTWSGVSTLADLNGEAEGTGWDDVAAAGLVYSFSATGGTTVAFTLIDNDGNAIVDSCVTAVQLKSGGAGVAALTFDDSVVSSYYFDLYMGVSEADMRALAGEVATVSVPVVPEPTTATLSLLALVGLAARRRRK